ncbi:hypothetical protein ACLK19_24505 [Escherichia coli]
MMLPSASPISAFVGGSLVERGGHNPLEAAAHAIPVLMGRILLTLKTFARGWSRQAGRLPLPTPLRLQKRCSSLPPTPITGFDGRHAVEVLYQNQGALQRLLQLLEPYLPPKTH